MIKVILQKIKLKQNRPLKYEIKVTYRQQYYDLQSSIPLQCYFSVSQAFWSCESMRAVFASQACLHNKGVHVNPCQSDQLNAKDTDMEKALLSCNATTKVQVTQRLHWYYVEVTALIL